MAETSVLPPTWEVPQEFRDRVGKQAGRQRVMLSDGHLLLILHCPPDPEELKRGARFFWRKPDGSWTSSELGTGPQALRRHLDDYAELLEKYDQQEEEAVRAEDYFDVLEALAPVHRAARHLYQTLQEARKMVPRDRDLINFRDRGYEIERTAELLYEETQNALNFAMAQRAEEQARSSRRMARSAHRLNILAAFFFPIATLSAIFGVNLEHRLEHAAAPIPFLVVLALGLIAGLILTSFVTEDADRSGRKAADGRGPGDTGSRTPDWIERAPSGRDQRFAGR